MDYSTQQATAILAAHYAIEVKAPAIRRLEKLGVFGARKNHRGEIILSDDDIGRLARIIQERRAVQFRLRQAAARAAQAARRAQRQPVFA